MLTKFEGVNKRGTTLSFPIENSLNGFFVKDVTGLDPVPAEIVSSSFANQDGEQYQASRRGTRNIVMKLGLEVGHASGSVRALRNELYKVFLPKTEVLLTFFDDEISEAVQIIGIVETCEVPLFAAEPEATISVICHESDFVGTTTTVVDGQTNGEGTPSPLLYNGTIETGMVFRLTAIRDVPYFSINTITEDGTGHNLDFQQPLNTGDVITISTIPGNKGARVQTPEGEDSVLYGVSPFSEWVQLYPGTNDIFVYAEGTPVPYTIEYTNKFGGL